MEKEQMPTKLTEMKGVLAGFAVGAAPGLFTSLLVAQQPGGAFMSTWCVVATILPMGLLVVLIAYVLFWIVKRREKARPEDLSAKTASLPEVETVEHPLPSGGNDVILATPVSEADDDFAAVYQEISRAANSKASWTNGILTLLATVVVFSVLALGQGGWKPLALVVGVLFVHELGHLAAMRLFGYRNLRMFFIPFFGAAVTGKNYNVAGWKKAVVSLMGPLPGIVVGAVMAFAALIYQSPALVDAASLLLIINAFNLLPIPPLDGGRLMEAVLFSRHPVLETAFRAVTAGLLMLSWFIGLKVLAVLGLFVLFSLPTTFRVGRVVRRLRKRGFDATSSDALTIPIETARSIYNEIKIAFPVRPKTKFSAQLTLNAFESLNSRPPRTFASLALVGIQGLTLLIALAGLMALLPHLVISQCTMAIKNNPTNANAFLMRGEASRWLGQQQQAVSDLTKAIEIDPKNALAYRARGNSYAVMERKDEARTDLRKALQLNPALRSSIQKISDHYGLGI
jgi:Zn-dependent protease